MLRYSGQNNIKCVAGIKVSYIKQAWNGARPSENQPSNEQSMRSQIAALCYTRQDGDLKILVITSRETKRWIIPKGWPIDGLLGHEAAAQEAWEEAGVMPAGAAAPNPVGMYHYDKRLDGDEIVVCETAVFPLEVARLADEFPEQGQRKRAWVSPAEAAKRVDEPSLKRILLAFDPQI